MRVWGLTCELEHEGAPTPLLAAESNRDGGREEAHRDASQQLDAATHDLIAREHFLTGRSAVRRHSQLFALRFSKIN